jgi:hypothetical protein
MLEFDKEDVKKTNYKFEIFDNIKSGNNTESYSAVSKYFKELEDNSVFSLNNNVTSKGMNETLYGTISTNKVCRIASYRRMADFTEVSDAIDEICDNSITNDMNNNQVSLKLPNTTDNIKEKEIRNAWKEYISLFDFENNMFEYMRNFVVDGELAWENVVSKDKPEAGILDLKFLPPESFEITYNLSTKEKVGITCYSDTDTDLNAHNQQQSTKHKNYGNSLDKKTIGGIALSNLNTGDALAEESAIFLPWSQITYINSGKWNSIGTFVYPVLEKARKAYNQLCLIEDAIIIYRLVRAPERLVFNVDIGKARRSKGEQEVLKMMKSYNTKKIYNPVNGTVSNDYDAHSMLESFWFVKTADSEGTSVETLTSGQNLGELDDLHYFLRKLYISLKIPYNRYEQPDVQIDRINSISYEEYRFAKFIMRLQSRFALGIKEGFKTHLALKNIEVNDLDLKIRFTPPSAFDIYEEQESMRLKIEKYSMLADREEFSKTILMEKYLGWTKEEIAENWKRLESDAVKQAIINFKVNNAEETGNPNPMGDDDDDY